jgi:hypothetical protein
LIFRTIRSYLDEVKPVGLGPKLGNLAMPQAKSESVTMIVSARGTRFSLAARPYDPYPLIRPQEHAPRVEPLVLAIQVSVAVRRSVRRLDRELARCTGRAPVGPGHDEGAVADSELPRGKSSAYALANLLLVHRRTSS